MNQSRRFRTNSTDILVLQGDITDQETDAIVNAANSSLMGGGGVDGAIHRRGGPVILNECRIIRRDKWPGGLPPGEAVSTGAAKLSARHVIHTVGPVWRGGTANEEAVLRNCYSNSLVLADSMGLASISFPSISTGAYGYPTGKACGIAVKAVVDHIHGQDSGISEVRFVLFSSADFRFYHETLKKIMSE